MIFWGIKYEPLSDPPPLKFVSRAPGLKALVFWVFQSSSTHHDQHVKEIALSMIKFLPTILNENTYLLCNLFKPSFVRCILLVGQKLLNKSTIIAARGNFSYLLQATGNSLLLLSMILTQFLQSININYSDLSCPGSRHFSNLGAENYKL